MSTADTLRITQPDGSSVPADPATLARLLHRATEDLEAERAEREQAVATLAEANKGRAVLERDKAVAEAMAAELQRQGVQLELERELLTDRLATAGAERDRALASMGRWARNRYQRQQAAPAADQPQK